MTWISRTEVVSLLGFVPFGEILTRTWQAEAPAGVGVGFACTADATVLFENCPPSHGRTDVFGVTHEEFVGVHSGRVYQIRKSNSRISSRTG